MPKFKTHILTQSHTHTTHTQSAKTHKYRITHTHTNYPAEYPIDRIRLGKYKITQNT